MSSLRTPIAILISGRGTNMQALVEAIDAGRLDAEVAVVISNRADAPGVAWATERGIPTRVMPHHLWQDRGAYDQALVQALREAGVTMVCLAGFMRVLGPAMIAAFPNAIINIHPSLLPSFPGVHPQQQAIDYGVCVSGVTVHFVTEALDAGPIIAQQVVPVWSGDSAETLAQRILQEEHQLYPLAVARVLAGGWRIVGRRVVWDAAE